MLYKDIRCYRNRKTGSNVMIISYYEPKWKWWPFEYNELFTWAFNLKSRTYCDDVTLSLNLFKDNDLSEECIDKDTDLEFTANDFIKLLAHEVEVKANELENANENEIYESNGMMIFPCTAATDENIDRLRSFIDKLIDEIKHGKRIDINVYKAYRIDDIDQINSLSNEDMKEYVNKAFDKENVEEIPEK